MRWRQHRAWEWKVPVMLEGCVSVRLAGGGGNRLWGWGNVEGGASGTQAFINAKGSRKEPHNSYFLLRLLWKLLFFQESGDQVLGVSSTRD